MKRATLEFLCCPDCHAELCLRAKDGDETVQEGLLVSSRCEKRFPIERGISRFVRPEELEVLNRRFGRFYDWLSHVYGLFTKAEMIRVARPGTKIVIAEETERVARLYDRIPGFSRSYQGKTADAGVPVHLVPDAMEEIRVDDIWKAHGQYHGYCLEFRKPAWSPAIASKRTGGDA